MFDKVSICFCRQQDNRKSPPQSPAKYVKTMVRVVVGDAICFPLRADKLEKTEAHRVYAPNSCSFSFGQLLPAKTKNVFLIPDIVVKIGINCTVGQGRPRWSASEKQIVADGSTFDYMYGLMNTTGIFISTKNQSSRTKCPLPCNFHLGSTCNV